MSINFANAVAAYGNAIGKGATGGMAPRDGAGDFSAALREAARDTIETLRQGETETLKAAAGKADLNDVVMAVSQADITLQTVVAVRDRVIQAYQDIMRMPI